MAILAAWGEIKKQDYKLLPWHMAVMFQMHYYLYVFGKLHINIVLDSFKQL